MKRFLKYVGTLVGLLAVGALLVVVVLTFQKQQNDAVFQSFQSPIETPTQPPRLTPTLLATSRPTSTRPPEPPTRTPTPTFTVAPPTPTPLPAPTLLPGLRSFVFSTTGAEGPEIYRGQIDPTASVVGAIHRMNTPALWHSRTYLASLHASPVGNTVAVSWAYGEGGAYISLLNANNGELASLFGEDAEIDQRVEFLDWSPDGNSVLVLGGIGNVDLGGSAWLVNTNTGEFAPIDIKQDRDARQITSASFLPDGRSVVYARSDCFQCGSEVWRLDLNQGEQRLLLHDAEQRIEDVQWSPDGHHIMFTQWRETTDGNALATGELWLMDADGQARRRLSSVATGYDKQFGPRWSPDSERIALVLGTDNHASAEMLELSSNVYEVDVLSGEITQLTHFQNVQVLQPTWLPDEAMMTFAASVEDRSGQFEPWIVGLDGDDLRRFGEHIVPIIDTQASQPMIEWLVGPLSGGAR